jgi:hypothetical protein
MRHPARYLPGEDLVAASRLQINLADFERLARIADGLRLNQHGSSHMILRGDEVEIGNSG